MEKKISYLNRTYADYKEALIAMSEKYYPDLAASFDDASIAAWQIDVAADIADNLSYHIDRVYQETNIDSAQEKASLYAIARNNGFKIPGPKGAMAEMKITVTLPISNSEPNYGVAPIVKRGTRFSSSSQQFELLEDVDFASQFDENGVSNRTITPNLNTNGVATGYTVSKLAVVTAGETRVYRQVVRMNDVQPFMEILLPIENVMNVESIVVVDGTGSTISPSYGVFYGSGCGGTTRFYEVDNLAQNWCWSEVTGTNGKAEVYQYAYGETPVYAVTKGEWKPVKHKFITEYTDKGYLKIIFGAGIDGDTANIGTGASSFAKWQMSKILNNQNLGVLPNPESTVYILYRVGGGKTSNVAKGAINRVSYLNADLRGEGGDTIIKSLRVENTTPSVSGKDMPSEREMRYLIKYHNAAQERCVTVKDYIDRILMLPPKYGTPFRVGVAEENNKIMVYLLGLNHNGKLDTALPATLAKNIEDYLSAYRMINDYVEIKSGRIINLSFEIDVIVDKNYNKVDVIREVINTVIRYMDVNSHIMGEELYMGDLQKEIGKVDGVINLISMNVINEFGTDYSHTTVSQETTEYDGEGADYKSVIDLEATDGVLYNEGDTMMEILYPEKDIRVRVKER
jgi:hypothetical protein